MTGGDEAAFRRFVGAERDGLLREALRLTGDPARAEAAVQAALATTRVRWGRRGTDPAETAADALADAAGRRALLGGAAQVVESLDDPPVAPPGPPPRWRLDTDAAVANALARARRHRRRRAGAAVAALAAAALAVPQVLPPGPAAPRAERGSAAPDAAPVLTGPTRGSLAADTTFLDSVRRVDWGPLDLPPAAERGVVLATDTPHGRVVLLTGTAEGDGRGVWLTGPVGAAADALTPYAPGPLQPHRPAALVVGGPGPASLVVVVARGDEVEVSPRLEIGPRGTPGRTYRPVPADDGVAVTTVPTTTLGAGTSVRVLHDGDPVHHAAVPAPALPAGTAEPPRLEPLRPAATPPVPRLVAEALTEVAVPLGAEPAALEPRLLWAGALPMDDVPGSVAVVVARSPEGGLVVTTRAGQVGSGGGGRTVPCGVDTPPGTTDVAGLVVARVCDLSSPETEPSDQGRWLVVTAPAEAVAADVLDGWGTVLATLPLTDGGATALLPDRAREVRTVDAAGRVLTEVTIGAAPTTPFGG
ncbi:hypothetical protein [Geodermatophilus sp. SYSU D00700]